MRWFVMRWRFAVSLFLFASRLLVSEAVGAEPNSFRHQLTLPLGFDPKELLNPRYYGGRSPVHDVVFSPDGKTLAGAFDDKSVMLFDLSTGRVSTTIKDPKHPFYCVAFSPDGKLLAYGGWDAKLWDLKEGRSSSLSPSERTSWV